jgi:hypothetical protein
MLRPALHKPAKYLVVIDAGGEMVARMLDAERRLIVDFDASSSEVAVMTQGLAPVRGAGTPEWDSPLAGHSRREREDAQVYTLDV